MGRQIVPGNNMLMLSDVFTSFRDTGFGARLRITISVNTQLVRQSWTSFGAGFY